MKFKQVLNHIHGSELKEQYLEAFLLQTTLLESLLKRLVEFHFWTHLQKSSGKDISPLEKYTEKFYSEIEGKIIKSSYSEQVRLLLDVGIIEKNLSSDLKNYGKKRNKIVHDLMNEMSSETFQEEIVETYTLGKKILENGDLKILVKIFEESR